MHVVVPVVFYSGFLKRGSECVCHRNKLTRSAPSTGRHVNNTVRLDEVNKQNQIARLDTVDE